MPTKKIAKAKPIASFTYPCVEAAQGTHTLIFFFAPAKELWQCVSINQKQEDDDGGYQRGTSASRVAAIVRYVEKSKPLPTSLLISLVAKAVTRPPGHIQIAAKKTSGWIIDGQHRLAGAAHAKKDILLPVIAFVGLSLDEQINQFVTINREARGVPTSLYYSLLKKLPPKLTIGEMAKERAADLGQQLKLDEESPFSGRIVSTTSPKTGQLSLTNFVRKVAPLVAEDKLLGPFTPSEQGRIIANFYIAVRNVYTKEYDRLDSVFFQTVGFGALLNFFPTLFTYALKESKSFSAADVTKILRRIEHVDVAAWHSIGSGSAAEIQLGNDLKEEFRTLTPPTDGDGAALRLD